MNILPNEFNVLEATCVLKFSADWCYPCKAVSPLLETISKEMDVEIYEVDIDTQYELTAQFDIRSIPTVVALKNGQLVDILVGTATKDKYEKLMSKVREV